MKMSQNLLMIKIISYFHWITGEYILKQAASASTVFREGEDTQEWTYTFFHGNAQTDSMIFLKYTFILAWNVLCGKS